MDDAQVNEAFAELVSRFPSSLRPLRADSSRGSCSSLVRGLTFLGLMHGVPMPTEVLRLAPDSTIASNESTDDAGGW
jgi:hypothetical protein